MSNKSNQQNNSDMTGGVGTPFYLAPEIKTNSYTNKVDMYSLGLIFFEMNFRPVNGMEKAVVFEGLRDVNPRLPEDFDVKRSMQSDIITSLLTHSVKDRPSSLQLLHSRKLPLQMESETLRETLASLTDSSSPYFQKVLAAFFSRPMEHAKDFAWDLSSPVVHANDLLMQGLVKQKLTTIFRTHGAVEASRSAIIPSSGYYDSNAVRLLDSNGTLTQLAYDLTFSHARDIAKHEQSIFKTFAFGMVYRDTHSGAAPKTFGEVCTHEESVLFTYDYRWISTSSL